MTVNRTSFVRCKHGHRFRAKKDGQFWPVVCPKCGAEAAPASWWDANPNGTTLIKTIPITRAR